MRTILLFLFFLSLPQFLKHNFKLPPHLNIPYHSEWEIPPPDEKILSILDQPFSYLARGNQSTVFESQDGKYVLKLFRYTRPRFPFVQNTKYFAAKLIQKKPKNDLFTKVAKTFTAAHMACTQASQYTQVLFCHLNLSENQLPTIQLKADRIYNLRLDQYRFVLQRKVSPFKETLLSAKNDPEKMHKLIDSFVKLLVDRASIGIRNADPNLGPNFGFLEDQAVEIDFGNYRKGSNPQEITNYLTRLGHWLADNAPEYIAFFNDLRYDSLKYETTEKLRRSPGTLY